MTEGRLRALIVVLGGLLIGLGLVQALFKFKIDPKVEQWIGQGLFLAAALLFIQLFQLRRRQAAAQRKEEDEGKP